MRRENNLGTDSMAGLVVRLAIPAMLAQFINVLYSIVDRIFIGNIPEIGATALAGVGICGPIVTLITSFSMWVGIGGSPLMSIKMGENDRKGASQIMANCFLMMIVMAVVITLLVILFKQPLLMLFGASEVTFPYANTYMTIYAAGSIFAILSMGMNTFIICQGYSKIAMMSVVVGAITNIVLDPVFSYGIASFPFFYPYFALLLIEKNPKHHSVLDSSFFMQQTSAVPEPLFLLSGAGCHSYISNIPIQIPLH